MAEYEIPLSSIPSQSFNVVLNNQDCTIALYARGEKYYFDLTVDGKNLFQGMIVQVGQNLTPYEYVGFVGSLSLIDVDGKNDYPDYTEFGKRYILVYDDGE